MAVSTVSQYKDLAQEISGVHPSGCGHLCMFSIVLPFQANPGPPPTYTPLQILV